MNQLLEGFLEQERPRSFKDILGHERWFETLVSNLKRERATGSHQPIALIGSPGVGKRTLAKMYAKALLCDREIEARIDAAPCGTCDECRAMEGSTFAYVERNVRGDPDDADEDAAQEQGEAVHTLVERDGSLNTASVRVVVFSGSEEFSSTAADIALKTLEQEVGSSLYVFVVNDEARFSAALRSRCGVFRVGPIPVESMVGRLLSICGRCSIASDEGALRAIAIESKGSFGEALAILARVQRHGHVTIENLAREPEFGWGPTMLTCWRAVLGDRLDEATALFGEIGREGPARVRTIQAFLVECRMRDTSSGWSRGTGLTPALDLLPAESWNGVLQDWAEWSGQRGIQLSEAVDRALGFWETVRLSQPWRAAFLKGYEALTEADLSMEPDGTALVDLES